MPESQVSEDSENLAKARTGITGLDEITNGGLPMGRASLITGGPGSGKTLMAMEFLVRGAQDFNEPGVFVAFEETADELRKNVRSLGFDLRTLIDDKKLAVDYGLKNELERKRRELERKRAVAEAQIAAMRAEIAAKEEEMQKVDQQEEQRQTIIDENREEMALRRLADTEAR